jgi:ascorbate-specific PTS system EIIC-type component UlaA
MINHRKIVIGFIGIIAVISVSFPVFDLIFNLMNQKSDFAYFGPILLFIAGFVGIWTIISLINSIKLNLWHTKVTGKSSKNKENKNN